MAEVLITLGIIGVVAAMTIPTLMTKIQEKELYAAWKRVYSVLNQAYRLASEEYGDYSGWEKTSADDYNKIRPYLKVMQDCPVGQGAEKCFTSGYITYFDKSITNHFINRKNQPAVRLISGESISFAYSGDGITFIVDLNNNKKPNQFGVDMHPFSISKDNVTNEYTVYPGVGGRWNSSARYCMRKSKIGNTTTGDGEGEDDTTWKPGSGCGFWILKHGNMDYLHMTDEQIKQNW